MSALALGNYKGHFNSLTLCDTFGSFLTVHRELTDRGEGDTEKTRGRGHDNQTEQKEAPAHPTAAHVPTAQGKFRKTASGSALMYIMYTCACSLKLFVSFFVLKATFLKLKLK